MLTLDKILHRMRYLYGENHFEVLGDTWKDEFLRIWREMYAALFSIEIELNSVQNNK